jgi:hypothetical protein
MAAAAAPTFSGTGSQSSSDPLTPHLEGEIRAAKRLRPGGRRVVVGGLQPGTVLVDAGTLTVMRLEPTGVQARGGRDQVACHPGEKV